MVNSMTGYGRHEAVIAQKDISVEIRSVNHRYTDFNIKVPRYYGFLEDKIRTFLGTHIARGKVDFYLTVYSKEEDDKVVSLNTGLAQNYVDVLNQLKTNFQLNGEVTVATVAAFSDVFDVERKEVDEDALWRAVEEVTQTALSDFLAMRQREGERLKLDLEQKSAVILSLVSQIEALAPRSVDQYREKITERIAELLGDAQIDESRILTEVAIFADKVAIDEELVRLKSHFEEMDNLLNCGKPIGRKLDFLLQEMNRETNTIGSKANDIAITKCVVEIKAELEKLREQVQNIE